MEEHQWHFHWLPSRQPQRHEQRRASQGRSFDTLKHETRLIDTDAHEAIFTQKIKTKQNRGPNRFIFPDEKITRRFDLEFTVLLNFFWRLYGSKKYSSEYEIVIRWTTIDYDINSSFSFFKKYMTNHYMIVENKKSWKIYHGINLYFFI